MNVDHILNIDIKKQMTDLQHIINNRVNYKDTLVGLCALTLFNQHKAKLLDNTLVFGEATNIEKFEVTNDLKEVITETWFKSI